jgi:hypothetical protein
VAGGNAASDWRDNVTANAGRAQSQPQRRSQSRSYLDAGRGLTVKTAKTAAIFLGYFVLFLVVGFAVLQFTPL